MKKPALWGNPFNFAALNMGMTYQNTWRILLIKLIFPLAYAGFFTVQFFINFDTTLSGSPDRYQIIKCRIQNNLPVASQKAKENKPVKTKFRLNRNFEPAVFTTAAGIYCIPAINFITIQRIRCTNPFIADPLHYTRLLRGPPYIS
ncbi:MAG TPA: hypothetical protein VII44_04080 [Puia sp.]